MTDDGTEIAVFPGAGAGALFVTEDSSGGYRFHIKGRRNHFTIATIADTEAIELAEAILKKTRTALAEAPGEAICTCGHCRCHHFTQVGGGAYVVACQTCVTLCEVIEE